MKDLQNPFIIPAALLLATLPYAVAFYHNKFLCDKDPVSCVAYEQRYRVEQHNFDLNGTLEQGMIQLEELVQKYTQ